MTRTVYLNGAWFHETEARVSVFDRGFLFADAIYEVTAVIGGKLIDYYGHAARLQRSLSELGIDCPLSEASLLDVHRDIVRRNQLDEGLIYLQISRGVADRDFAYPANALPTLVLFTQAKPVLNNPRSETGLSIATLPDWRWERRDIKTVQLLYPSMAKMEAMRRGADDAWLVQDGLVTEGSAATAHIVKADGTLVTRGLSNALLHGITRASIIDLARGAGMVVEERAFSVTEAQQAAEAFITSATNFATSVVKIDDFIIGDGKPGPIAGNLRKLYTKTRLATAI
uniref:Probable branched-chain-amino-acid aminotransferase n=1 Tax=Rhizobium leguminosarum TaxID=384 RepID=A0A179BPV4_RHILE|nr:D-amino-acid transaminase [Rhizobium leguminosarum]OAP93776.1 D-amino acid aminotransferase [Rhizobium leguminosarum]